MVSNLAEMISSNPSTFQIDTKLKQIWLTFFLQITLIVLQVWQLKAHLGDAQTIILRET